jgi:hypothetical protein
VAVVKMSVIILNFIEEWYRFIVEQVQNWEQGSCRWQDPGKKNIVEALKELGTSRDNLIAMFAQSLHVKVAKFMLALQATDNSSDCIRLGSRPTTVREHYGGNCSWYAGPLREISGQHGCWTWKAELPAALHSPSLSCNFALEYAISLIPTTESSVWTDNSR